MTATDTDRFDLFVDGRHVESSGDRRIDVDFPYDGTVWATVPDATAEDVDDAVSAARAAFDEWRETQPTERAEFLGQIAAVFDVTLDEQPGGLQPLHEMDRLQPDNDALGIGVGSLCVALCKKLDLPVETNTMLGHGSTARNYKQDNLPTLLSYAEALDA